MTSTPPIETCASIHAAAFHDSRAWSAQEIKTLLSSEHCFCVGDSFGFAIGRVIAGEAELLTIAVLPERRGKGHGRTILKDYHAKAEKRGATEFFLEVAADNKPAINLYESVGYRIASVRQNYYQRTDGNKVDALILHQNAACSS